MERARGIAILLAATCLASVAAGSPGGIESARLGTSTRSKNLVRESGLPAPSVSVPYLYRLGTEDAAVLDAAAARGATPVCYIDGYALAWGSKEMAADLRGLGVDVDLLGRKRSDRSYAVVFLAGRMRSGRADRLEDLGVVLYRGARTAVLEYDQAQEERLWRSYSITHVSDRPIRHPSPAARVISKRVVEEDPAVLEYVEQVDDVRLHDLVLHMQNLAPRTSPGPGAFGTSEWIHDEFLTYGLTDVGYFDYNSWSDDVVAVQVGKRDPDEIYVIGGHYDSFSYDGSAPGADDDASGTAGVLEAARILAPHEFEATIIYIAFSGEEQGLVGSSAWAENARGRNLDIRGMINLDMLGYVAPGFSADLDLISNPASQPLRDFIVNVASIYLPDHPVVDGFLSGGNSDHYPFWMNGYQAIFFFEDSGSYSPYIHTAQDVIGTSLNDFAFMKRNVQTAVATTASLARPIRVRIDHDPVVDPAPSDSGYRLVASIESVAPLLQDSLRVRYRVDGGASAWLSLEAVDSADVYVAVVPPLPIGSLVEYAIRARDIEGRTAWDPPQWPSRAHHFVIGLTTAFADSFNLDQGWRAGESDDTAETGRWVRAAPIGTGAQPSTDAGGDSSGFCYLTGNGSIGGEIGEADVDGGRTTLTSPRIDLENAVRVEVEYMLWYVDETNNDDTLAVLLSSDDGRSWVTLDRVAVSKRQWRSVRHERLETLVVPSESTRIRFVAEDVGLPSLVEAAVDDFHVLAAFVEPAPEPPLLPSKSRLTLLWPVPFHRELSIGYALASDATAHVSVYDLQGRRAIRLDEIPQGAGPHSYQWSGKDAKGRRVPSGAYFLELATEDGSRSAARVVKIEGTGPQ